MNTTTKTKEYTLDATDKKLGRFATEIAVLLIGKNEPEYRPNVLPDVKVLVSNVEQLAVDQKKAKTKTYIRHSGYPGGQKVQTLAQLQSKKGMAEVLTKAVYGMLPINKLRKERIKNLIVN